jgi:hypothetical protein
LEAVVPSVERRWLDTECLQRSPRWQKKLELSFLVSPIPDHTFFKQPQFERRLGDNFFQVLRLTPKIFDLRAGSGSCGVAGKTTLAGLQKLFRPAVQALGNAFTAAEYCLRVARRMSFTIRSDDGFWISDFCLISTPQWLR